jgi:glycosyltransferase involved in cell wall biosynthesis
MIQAAHSGGRSVCMLVQNYYEIDIRVRRKAEALVAEGYSVDVLALRSSFSKEPVYTLEGVTVYTLDLGKKRGSLVRYAYEYAAFFVWAFVMLWRLMPQRKYSMVDVNTLPDFLVFAALPARLRGAKLVLDMHEITPEFYMSKYDMKPGALLVRVLGWIEKISFKFADHVITINEPIQRLLEGRGLRGSNSTVIMNSVDEGIFASARKVSVGGEANPGKRRFVMMYHGTLTHIYGLDIAIEAFAIARDRLEGAEFWILGNGPEKAALQELCLKRELGDRVKFLGSVLPEQVPQLLAQCDAGVLATRRDIFLDFSFSNKLSEYIIMGKAVISSRLRAIRHYFTEDALAFFEPNNPASLAEQMVQVYQSTELQERLKRRAAEEYAPICWEVMKERYLTMVQNLTRPKSETKKSAKRELQVAGPAHADNR